MIFFKSYFSTFDLNYLLLSIRNWLQYLFIISILQFLYILLTNLFNSVPELTEVNDNAEESNLSPPKKKSANSAASDVLSSENLADHAQSIVDEMEIKRKNDETLITGIFLN